MCYLCFFGWVINVIWCARYTELFKLNGPYYGKTR